MKVKVKILVAECQNIQPLLTAYYESLPETDKNREETFQTMYRFLIALMEVKNELK